MMMMMKMSFFLMVMTITFLVFAAFILKKVLDLDMFALNQYK
jgi:hypothetical protein